jgi:hypothetical protein
MPRPASKTCSRGHRYAGPDPCPVCWPGYRTYDVRAKVWIYPGQAAWHFASIPKKTASEIKTRFGASARGWGSLRVTATIGKTSWETSIFPDKKTGTYLLPLKAAVRKKEKVEVGKTIAIKLEVQA